MQMVSVLFKLLSIIDHLLINICMTKPPQHYEVTFLEEWEKINYREQILIVISEFQSGWNSAHSQDKLKKKKKNQKKEGKESSESKKYDRRRFEKSRKNSAEMEER